MDAVGRHYIGPVGHEAGHEGVREDPLNQIWYKSIHWGLLGIWVKYNVFVPFLFIYTFFSETRVQVRPVDEFLRAIAH